MNILCENENCKHEFEPVIYEKYLGAMISETYFKCPKCGKKYIISLDNCKTRNLKIKINNLKARLRIFKTNKVINEKLDHAIYQHRTEMKRLMKGEYS